MTSTLPTLEEFKAECDRKREVFAQRFSHITPPADATTVGPWCDEDGQGGSIARSYVVTERIVGSAHVAACGIQQSDGSDERTVYVSSEGTADIGELDATDARGLAGALLDAARHLDGRRATVVSIDELAAALDAYDRNGSDQLAAIARRLIAQNTTSLG